MTATAAWAPDAGVLGSHSGCGEHPDPSICGYRVATDLREGFDRSPQVNHCVVLSARRVEDVGEMVLDGALQVPIPDLPTKFDRRRAVPQSGLDIPSTRLGESQSGQGGDPSRRVGRVGGVHGAPGLDPGRLRITQFQ
jgi:hypothetical protein